MSTLTHFRFPELNERTRRILGWILLFCVALLVLTASTGAMAQTTSLDTSRIDGAICSVLKIVKKFAFYALIVTFILVGIAIKMDESKGLVTRAVQIVVGVWVILNAIALATLLFPSVSASFCSEY